MADPILDMLTKMQAQIQSRLPKTDRERALARFNQNNGVVSEPDSIFLGLKARAAQPNSVQPYAPKTELERSAMRVTNQEWTPEEKPYYTTQYPGSATASLDTLALKEKGMFGGLPKEPPKLSVLEQHAKALAGMESTPAESLKTYKRVMEIGTGISPKATEPEKTPLQQKQEYRNSLPVGSQEREEANADIQRTIGMSSPKLSLEDAYKGRSDVLAIKDKIINGATFSDIARIMSRMPYMSGINQNIKESDLKDEETRRKLLLSLDDRIKYYDTTIKNYDTDAFKTDYAKTYDDLMAQAQGKNIEIDTTANIKFKDGRAFNFKWNGKEWILNNDLK